ncbi:MAG: hypothetical protein ACI4RA_00395 [Kiritimatiellia bacterium]
MSTLFLSRLQGQGHTNAEIPFDWTALFTRGIIVLQRNIWGNSKGRGACSRMPNTLSYRDSVDFIRRGIQSGRPFMAGKIGTGDNETMLRYIDIHDKESVFLKSLKLLLGKRRPFWWDNSIRAGISVCAGVFPNDIVGIEEFCRIYETYIPEMDGFGSCADGETRIHDRYCPQATAIAWESLFPLREGYSWYDALKGKRVLVVHPYLKSIAEQYKKARRVELHKGQGPLPEFELILYRPVNSIGGHCAGFARWKDALQHMIDDVSKIDFDIALVGCGVYGVPLSVHIKRMGRVAIHTGGSTQLIFGIKAKVYDGYGFYNEHWIRPLPDDIPENMGLIERGRFL